MQLISLPVSPFAARVRIACYAKGLPVDVVPPPAGWPNNPQFRQISPTGRVPVLVLDDGEAIWESAVILEALEDLFPDAPALLPRDALARARARLLVRHVDLYLMPPMVELARPQPEGETRLLVERLLDGLTVLGGLLDGGSYAAGGDLTIADCALAPALFAARVTGDRLAIDLTAGLPGVRAFEAATVRNEYVARVLGEMEEGLRRLVPTS